MREREGGTEKTREAAGGTKMREKAGGASVRLAAGGGQVLRRMYTRVERVRLNPRWVDSLRFLGGSLPLASGSECWRRETSSLRRRDKIRTDAGAPYMAGGDIADGQQEEKVG